MAAGHPYVQAPWPGSAGSGLNNLSGLSYLMWLIAQLLLNLQVGVSTLSERDDLISAGIAVAGEIGSVINPTMTEAASNGN